MRKAAIITIAIVLAIALLLATYGTLRLYSSSIGSLSGGWIHSFSEGVEYLSLTVNGNQISGQEQEETETNDTSPQAKSDSTNVSGTVNGANVSLTFSVLGLPVRTYAGTYENDTLTLSIPDQAGNLQSVEYHHASTDDYNKAVQKLQQTVAQQDMAYNDAVATSTATAYQQQLAAATATATADEQQSLASDISNMAHFQRW